MRDEECGFDSRFSLGTITISKAYSLLTIGSMMLTEEYASFFKPRRKKWFDSLREHQGYHVKWLSCRWKYDPMGYLPGHSATSLALELVPEMETILHSQGMVLYGEERMAGGFPKAARNYYGLERGFPKVVLGKEVYSLTVLEDNYNFSFKDMAELLESQGDHWDGSYMYCISKSKNTP